MNPLDQFALWNGAEGETWAAFDDRYDALLEKFTDPILDAAKIEQADTVLDVGCGCGCTTRRAAQRAKSGHAHGVDLSAPMLERARRRATEQGLRNTTFEQRDAQDGVPGEYDVIVSRFGVMFFPNVQHTFGALTSSLRHGGRLSFVCWRERAANENRTVPHAALSRHLDMPVRPAQPGRPGAFSLADPDHVAKVLTTAGLHDVQLTPLDAPMWFGTDAEDAVKFHLTDPDVAAALAAVSEDVAQAAVNDLRAAFAAHETADGVLLGGAAWLVSAWH